MMTDAQGRKADPRFISDLRAWRQREALIIAGGAIPTRLDRLRGHSPFQASALLDLRQLVAIEIARDQHNSGMIEALQKAADVPTGEHCFWAAEMAISGGEHDFADVLHWHAALRGHGQSIHKMLALALSERRPADPVGWAQWIALVVGLAMISSSEPPGGWIEDGMEADEVPEARERGLARLGALSDLAMQLNRAEDEIDSEGDAPAGTPLENALAGIKKLQEAEAIDDMLEDRAEIERIVENRPSKVVLPALPPKSDGKNAGVIASMKPIAGTPLPLISTDRLAAARTTLHALHPHMTAEIDVILGTQAPLQSARLNILLISNSGTGKTTVARDLCEAMGVPSMVYSCGGASDAAFGGTSAQWHSARASTPLQMVARSMLANPCVILDEIDKIGTSRHNGSLSDSLLAFLEPSSSRRIHDLALECEVDLSGLSYIATANVLDDVPAALRDRFKIIRVPEPGWQHIGALSKRIIGDLAKERGLDPRWIEPLGQDEVDLVRKAWPGGSIRVLTRIVTTIVDGRERFLGRA